MKYDNGQWIMQGVAKNAKNRIRTLDELIDYVNQVGFLPLFSNSIAGFSVEEKVYPGDWWTKDAVHDPWEWRGAAARSGKVAYGKFFDKKAGFISLEWLPYFVNYRRDGYDFNSRYDEGLAKRREHLIMQLFEHNEELFSHEIKSMAGFGKDGEKNFSGIVTDLQMQTYLVIKDFRHRINKKGQAYGMDVAVYTTPETLFGYDLVTSAYTEEPEFSGQRIVDRIRELYPAVTEAQLKKL